MACGSNELLEIQKGPSLGEPALPGLFCTHLMAFTSSLQMQCPPFKQRVF